MFLRNLENALKALISQLHLDVIVSSALFAISAVLSRTYMGQNMLKVEWILFCEVNLYDIENDFWITYKVGHPLEPTLKKLKYSLQNTLVQPEAFKTLKKYN